MRVPAAWFSSSGGWDIFADFRDKIVHQRAVRNSDKLRQELAAASDAPTFTRLVTQLSEHSPREAISTIEKAWASGKVPIDEDTLKIYLKAVARVGKIDHVNISGLMTLFGQQQQQNSPGATAIPGGTDIKQQLALIEAIQSRSGSALGGAGSIGTNPDAPIFVSEVPQSTGRVLMTLFSRLLGLFIVMAFVASFMEERTGGGMRGIMGNNVQEAEDTDKTFNDVVGVDEAKQELEEIVLYLKDPTRFTRLGGKLPKGVLLTGPPGTGKTLLAKAVAGEAGVPFLFSSGAEFEEMFVGVGARRVRDLFAAARRKSPCIIFIDEIDAVGGKRDKSQNQTVRATLNQLLVEMDGFKEDHGVIVIAATNLSDRLDPALTRPGRFDKHVTVPLPDIGGRRQILELYGKKMVVEKGVDFEQIARGTAGFSGADLYNLMNEAAIHASVKGLKSIGLGALEWAKDKVMMGRERKTAIISPETMKLTAFHEAGHALVALKTAGSEPIHKATIMPRGQALGMVMQLTDGDGTSFSRKQMLARLDVCMGGRVAEELVFGEDEVTSGASSDLMQATRLARAMVTQYGLSEKVGVIHVDSSSKSGETQKIVDEEIRTLVTDSYARAKELLTKHRRDLDILANGLLEYETLSGGEIVSLLKGKKPDMKNRSQKPSRDLKEITKPLPERPGAGSKSTPSYGSRVAQKP